MGVLFKLFCLPDRRSHSGSRDVDYLSQKKSGSGDPHPDILNLREGRDVGLGS